MNKLFKGLLFAGGITLADLVTGNAQLPDTSLDSLKDLTSTKQGMTISLSDSKNITLSLNEEDKGYSFVDDTIYYYNPNPSANPFIKEAEKYLGTSFKWEGRDTKKNPSLDCLGLVFRAYSKATNQDWTKYPVKPWEMISQRTFGPPVKGLDGVLKKDIDYNKLREGDVVHILSTIKAEESWKPMAVINETNYYGHHLVIYIGGDKMVHANPYFFPEEVIIHSFKKFLDATPLAAIYVTRPKN